MATNRILNAGRLVVLRAPKEASEHMNADGDLEAQCVNLADFNRTVYSDFDKHGVDLYQRQAEKLCRSMRKRMRDGKLA